MNVSGALFEGTSGMKSNKRLQPTLGNPRAAEAQR